MNEVSHQEIDEVTGGMRVGIVLPAPDPIPYPLEPTNWPVPLPDPGCPAPEPFDPLLIR